MPKHSLMVPLHHSVQIDFCLSLIFPFFSAIESSTSGDQLGLWGHLYFSAGSPESFDLKQNLKRFPIVSIKSLIKLS